MCLKREYQIIPLRGCHITASKATHRNDEQFVGAAQLVLPRRSLCSNNSKSPGSLAIVQTQIYGLVMYTSRGCRLTTSTVRKIFYFAQILENKIFTDLLTPGGTTSLKTLVCDHFNWTLESNLHSRITLQMDIFTGRLFTSLTCYWCKKHRMS